MFGTKKLETALFGIGVLFFLGLVGSMIFSAERTVQVGDRIILQTRPVDPRDLFRGEYVILRYAIENDEKIKSAASKVSFQARHYGGAPLYVQLRTDERGIASVVQVQEERPAQLAGWIRGHVTDSGVRFPGIEQFYVPEGTGKMVEDLRQNLHVEISLNRGNAQLVGLLDGDLNPISLVPPNGIY